MAEPILWAHKAAATRTRVARRWNDATQKLEVVIDEDTGLPVRERIPQRAHEAASGYSDPRLSRHQRSLYVLQHDGTLIHIPLTMGAGDVDGLDHVGKYMRAKARHFGWLPVGQCPIRAVAAGTVQPHQLRDAELRASVADGTARACQGQHNEERWCPHFVAEEKARKEANARVQAKRAAANQSEADKLIRAGQQQTKDIVSGVATALADAIRSTQPEPAPRSKRGEAP
jgi:hypothetical protein